MKNYTGKTVFLGIDVHKKTYTVAAICDGALMKKATLEASPDVLIGFCRKYFPGASIESAYEAGFCGFHLHRALEKNDINNRVVHAAGIEVSSGNRVKTDKRDAIKIATQLAAGRLRGIHVPSEEREAKRALTRLRDQIVEHRTAVANQIKSLLYQHGLIAPNSKAKVSSKWVENLKKLQIPGGIRRVMAHLADMWQQHTTRIKEINSEMAHQAIEDHALEKIYRSCPGVGPTGARVLANELEDMSHFENERQLFSYTGLTPSEHSSGGHVRKGHISRQGKTLIRKILVLASWKAIKMNRSLRETFERIAMRAGVKRAIVAIARRFVGHIRACFRKKCLYQKDPKCLVAVA